MFKEIRDLEGHFAHAGIESQGVSCTPIVGSGRGGSSVWHLNPRPLLFPKPHDLCYKILSQGGEAFEIDKESKKKGIWSRVILMFLKVCRMGLLESNGKWGKIDRARLFLLETLCNLITFALKCPQEGYSHCPTSERLASSYTYIVLSD